MISPSVRSQQNIIVLKVQVTKDDIIYGQQNLCTQCPVALAIARACIQQLGIRYIVGVVQPNVYFCSSRSRPKAYLPDFVSHAINLYDDSGVMEPMEFALELRGEGNSS